MEKYAPSLEIP